MIETALQIGLEFYYDAKRGKFYPESEKVLENRAKISLCPILG